MLHHPTPRRLDLGSGPKPAEGYVGVDRCEGERVIGWDFTHSSPWPFETESIEALRSSHLIEHLPLVNARGRDILLHFFEEAWRVAKPGALFELRWPVPFHPDTGMPVVSAWWDPTHYRHIPLQTIWSYLTSEGRRAMSVESYGVRCNWVARGRPAIRTLHVDPLVLEYDVELERRS
jgi:SAM-dependent methyltransferase